MATGGAGTSGAAAYQRLEKPDNEISDSLKYWGGIQAQANEAEKARQARRGEEDRARKDVQDATKKKQEDKWEDQYSLKGDEYETKATGFDSYDDMMRSYALETVDKNAEYNRKAMEARKAGDSATARMYEAKISKLKNAFSNMKNGEDAYGKLNADYVARAAKGDIADIDADEWEGNMDMVHQNNMRVTYDDNDNIIYKGKRKNDDGTEEEVAIPNSALIDGNYYARSPVPLVGKGGLVDDVLQQLGKRTYDNVTGYLTTSSQVWDSTAQRGTSAAIDTVLASNDKGSVLYYDLFKEKIPRGQKLTEAQREKVKSKVTDMIKAGYDEKVSKKFDSAQYRADKAGEKDKNKDNPYSARKFDIQQILSGEEPVQFGGDLKWEGTNYNVTKSYLSPDGKNVVLEASYTPKGKTTPKNKNIVIPKNERTLNNLFDGFSDKVLDFDKVIKSDPYAYRDTQSVPATKLEEQLADHFSDDGSFDDDNKEFIAKVKELYPDAVIKDTSKWWSTSNGITINGKRVLLDNGYDQAMQGVKEALGIQNKPNNSQPASAAPTTTKPSTADPLGLGI